VPGSPRGPSSSVSSNSRSNERPDEGVEGEASFSSEASTALGLDLIKFALDPNTVGFEKIGWEASG